jgi:O-antigen/teichoic acid export membrane protein
VQPDERSGDQTADARPAAGSTGRAIAHRTVGYWVGTVVALAGSLARGKIFAVALGTSGVGVLAQLANFAALLTGLATLGLSGAGATLLGRERANADAEPRRRIASTIIVAPIAASAVLMGAAAIWAGPLSKSLLGTPHHKAYIVIAAASVPANALTMSYQVIMQGHERAWRTAWNSALAAVAMVAAVALLVVPFGLAGGVASVAVTSVVAAVVVILRERWITADAWPPRSAGRDVNRLLLRFGAASLIAGSATALVDLILRSDVVTHLGTSANGLYQPVYLLGSLVFAQLGAGVVTALTPGISAAWAAADHAAVRAQINSGVRLSLLAMVPLILLATAGRTFLVTAVFSGSFAAAAPVLALALTAELPRCLTYAMGGFMLPAGLIRTWVGLGLTAESIRLSLGLLLLRSGGIDVLAVVLVIEWTFMAAATLVVAHRQGIRLERRLKVTIAASTALVAAAYAATRTTFDQTIVDWALVLAAGSWVWICTTRAQRSWALRRIGSALASVIHRR